MIFTTLLTDNYIKYHKLFVQTMQYFNPYFDESEQIILYVKDKLTKFDKIQKYLPSVTFLEVPTDFLKYRNLKGMLYPYFAITFDKLYLLYSNIFGNQTVVLYDADMVCLRPFEIEVNNGVVLGSTDPTSKINTGFVVFGKEFMSDLSFSRMAIEDASEELLSLPDQELINKYLPCFNFQKLKVLNKPLWQLEKNKEDLKNYDVLHYITDSKPIKSFINDCGSDFVEKKVIELTNNNLEL